MRPLKNKLILTFPTTVAAMAMEKAAAETGTPGRLIPTPTVISAGCGMCWCAEPEQETACIDLLRERQLCYEGIFHL